MEQRYKSGKRLLALFVTVISLASLGFGWLLGGNMLGSEPVMIVPASEVQTTQQKAM